MTLPSAEREDGLDANISAFPHPRRLLLHHTGVFPFWYFLVLNLVLVGTCWPFSFLILYFFIFMVKFLYFPQPRHLLLHHIWYFLVLLLLLTKKRAKNGQIVTFRIPPSSIFLIQFSTFQAIGVDLCAAGCCATGFPLQPLHCCIIGNLFIGGV